MARDLGPEARTLKVSSADFAGPGAGYTGFTPKLSTQQGQELRNRFRPWNLPSRPNRVNTMRREPRRNITVLEILIDALYVRSWT